MLGGGKNEWPGLRLESLMSKDSESANGAPSRVIVLGWDRAWRPLCTLSPRALLAARAPARPCSGVNNERRLPARGAGFPPVTSGARAALTPGLSSLAPRPGPAADLFPLPGPRGSGMQYTARTCARHPQRCAGRKAQRVLTHRHTKADGRRKNKDPRWFEQSDTTRANTSIGVGSGRNPCKRREKEKNIRRPVCLGSAGKEQETAIPTPNSLTCCSGACTRPCGSRITGVPYPILTIGKEGCVRGLTCLYEALFLLCDERNDT
ncbi:hypothetical protein NDU88_006937 [Pleurodeles waltl]|uniref:Uncharacterized protein n=1 Tax=Pleurodeles waltl TaxID=8319 RepID=A0AAV7LS43_PLEWA|nr:hypothetical protein NDU88_006937 [Pleurodeles waltl]